jgi:hypothetical protein
MSTNQTPTAAAAASNRKPYNNRAGYLSSLRSGAGRGWVVIYDAAAAGLDATGGRYAIACETHHTLTNAKSMPAARSSMKEVGFCEECTAARLRAGSRGTTGITAGAAYDAVDAEPRHLAAAPVATAELEPEAPVAAVATALERLTAAAAAELELNRSPRLLMLTEGVGNYFLMLAEAAGVLQRPENSVCTASAFFPAPARVYSADYSEPMWFGVFKYGGCYFLQAPSRLSSYLRKADAALLIVQATSAAATGAVAPAPEPLQQSHRQALAEVAAQSNQGGTRGGLQYREAILLPDAELVAAAGFTPILAVAPEALQQLQEEARAEGELSPTQRLRLIEIIYEHTPMRGEGGRWLKDTRGTCLRCIWEAGRWLELRSCSDTDLLHRALRRLVKQPAEPPVAAAAA